MGLKEPGLRGSLRNTGSVTPAFFDVTITNTNSPVQEGDILTVDYSADNTGDAQDMQDIRLEIDSVQEDVDPGVMLAGGASTTGTLEWDTTDEPEAEYTATVLSDDDSDSVMVEIGSAIPDRVVEDWERSSPLNDYIGDTSGWSITTTDVIEGDQALAQDGATGGDIIHTNNSIEGSPPQRGENVACLRRADDNDDSDATGFLLLDDDEWMDNNELSGYYPRHQDGDLQLFRLDDGSLTLLDSAAIDGGDPNDWADIEVIPDGEDLTVNFYLLDSSIDFEQEESRDDDPAASLTVTDGSYGWGRTGYRAPAGGNINPSNDYLRVL